MDQFDIHRVVYIGPIERQCADAALLGKENGVARYVAHGAVSPGDTGIMPRFT